MRYSEAELLEYARHRVQLADDQAGRKILLGVIGTAGIVCTAIMIQFFDREGGKMGDGEWTDTRFLFGVGFGIFLMLFIFYIAFFAARLFRIYYGKEIETIRAFVRLKEGGIDTVKPDAKADGNSPV